MLRIALLAAGFVLLVFAVAIIADALLMLVSGTGPNCPGMDPTWLGQCEYAR